MKVVPIIKRSFKDLLLKYNKWIDYNISSGVELTEEHISEFLEEEGLKDGVYCNLFNGKPELDIDKIRNNNK